MGLTSEYGEMEKIRKSLSPMVRPAVKEVMNGFFD
jgi:hypothetical protein